MTVLWGLSRQIRTSMNRKVERAAGIEPASLAWKAKVLPLHNARDLGRVSISPAMWGQGGHQRASPVRAFCVFVGAQGIRIRVPDQRLADWEAENSDSMQTQNALRVRLTNLGVGERAFAAGARTDGLTPQGGCRTRLRPLRQTETGLHLSARSKLASLSGFRGGRSKIRERTDARAGRLRIRRRDRRRHRLIWGQRCLRARS